LTAQFSSLVTIGSAARAWLWALSARVSAGVVVIVLVTTSGIAPTPCPVFAERSDSDSAHTVPAALGPSTLSGRMVRLIRDDGRHFLTRRTALVLLAGAALTGASVAFEDPDRTEDLLSGPTWEHVADLGNLYGNGATLGIGALALVATGEMTGDGNIRAAGWDAVRSLGYAFTIVGGLKVAVHRTRPDGGRHSFPSGHAAGAFAIAPVLARHFGIRVAIPAYTLAIATTVGRLEDRKHYLSDVVFGAALGTCVGLAVASSGLDGSGVRVSVAPGHAGLSVGF
jgi:membrane-associated phospholipid phosphatase